MNNLSTHEVSSMETAYSNVIRTNPTYSREM